MKSRKKFKFNENEIVSILNLLVISRCEMKSSSFTENEITCLQSLFLYRNLRKITKFGFLNW